MVTKKVRLVVERDRIIQVRAEFRLFGILLYSKEVELPEKYGVKEYNYPSI